MLRLRVGEVVVVRSAEEILATLDADGRLDGMPFMPEMLPFCGQEFTVLKRAHKACDTITRGIWRLRRVDDAVHLSTRCDGAAHGGCEAACMLFWKEAWLKRAASKDDAPPPDRTPACSAATLVERTQVVGTDADGKGPTYACQATELLNASHPMSLWDVRAYVADIWSGNATLWQTLKACSIYALNTLQQKRKGRSFPHFQGSLQQTPRERLDLQAGELIQVKTLREIEATLDVKDKNRGLSFDAEMVPYCGSQVRVQQRVAKIINEASGKMMRLPGDCIMLEGAICESRYHLMCPRGIFPYWREVWLSRPAPTGEAGAAPPAATPSRPIES
ncbi:MAG TPA: hypothetical protein VGI12_16115 [Vicinamibacterales bacterium]